MFRGRHRDTAYVQKLLKPLLCPHLPGHTGGTAVVEASTAIQETEALYTCCSFMPGGSGYTNATHARVDRISAIRRSELHGKTCSHL